MKLLNSNRHLIQVTEWTDEVDKSPVFNVSGCYSIKNVQEYANTGA